MQNINVLTKPLSVEEIQKQLKEKDCVSGIIPIDLEFFLSGDDYKSNIEAFDDHVSRLLVGSDLLMDIGYNIAGCDPKNNTVFLEITGDPSAHLETNSHGGENE